MKIPLYANYVLTNRYYNKDIEHYIARLMRDCDLICQIGNITKLIKIAT